MANYRLADLSIFYVSFDEPWRQEFFADLRAKAPRAENVHGVTGHDNAVKECARRSRTDRFLVVDADNLVRPEFLDFVVDDTNLTDAVFSFSGHNTVNGLEYGNGGPACWPRTTAERMASRGAGSIDGRADVDFCWATPTFVTGKLGSDVHITRTPYHAFRAGYREGVKMTLLDGVKLDSLTEVQQLAEESNWNRLLIWTSVGADVENGAWAVFGARQALWDIWVEAFPTTLINDYGWFTKCWESWSKESPVEASTALGTELNR
ncbi:MAG TPA: hypothetical protein VI248_03500, partial [Kineosporiaceae bacterium]